MKKGSYSNGLIYVNVLRGINYRRFKKIKEKRYAITQPTLTTSFQRPHNVVLAYAPSG